MEKSIEYAIESVLLSRTSHWGVESHAVLPDTSARIDVEGTAERVHSHDRLLTGTSRHTRCYLMLESGIPWVYR